MLMWKIADASRMSNREGFWWTLSLTWYDDPNLTLSKRVRSDSTGVTCFRFDLACHVIFTCVDFYCHIAFLQCH